MTDAGQRAKRADVAIAQQLARSIKRNSHLANRLSLMRKAFEMLNAAVTNGQLRVIDGVLHYDHETKLADYCEGVLRQDDQLKVGQDDSARNGLFKASEALRTAPDAAP